jgi:hypothetical protein
MQKIENRRLRTIAPPRIADIDFRPEPKPLALVTCWQCSECVVSKRGRYLTINQQTELLEPHAHQPGDLCWRAYEDDLTGEPLNKRTIQHRIAAIRRREAAKGK